MSKIAVLYTWHAFTSTHAVTFPISATSLLAWEEGVKRGQGGAMNRQAQGRLTSKPLEDLRCHQCLKRFRIVRDMLQACE